MEALFTVELTGSEIEALLGYDFFCTSKGVIAYAPQPGLAVWPVWEEWVENHRSAAKKLESAFTTMESAGGG